VADCLESHPQGNELIHPGPASPVHFVSSQPHLARHLVFQNEWLSGKTHDQPASGGADCNHGQSLGTFSLQCGGRQLDLQLQVIAGNSL